MDRKWLHSFAELIDRLSIHQLKEVFITEHKEKYAKEMKDIMHDLDLLIKEQDIEVSGQLIRAVVVLSQINTHIWYNESKARKGIETGESTLALTHGLNGIRNRSMNHILDLIGETEGKDWKVDCIAEEFKDWDISI